MSIEKFFDSLSPTKLAIALLCTLATTSLPADDYKLEDWTLGEIVAGDEMDLSKLDGRVVAIEFWGTR
jgi:hypothetical protein